MRDPDNENKERLLAGIRSVHPELQRLGVDLDADYDREQQIWVVSMKKGSRMVRAYLEPADADSCMNGRQCVTLGIEVAQLRVELENP